MRLSLQIQVLYSFCASHGPLALALCSSTQIIDKELSKYVNRSLSQSFLSIFADVAVVTMGALLTVSTRMSVKSMLDRHKLI